MVNLVFACILDSTLDQETADCIDERKPTFSCIFTKCVKNPLKVFGVLTLVCPCPVHLISDLIA